jgi:hypothetical protein
VRALTFALVVLVCWLLVVWRRQRRARKQDEWDIREATFLYQTRGLGANPCYLEATCVPQPKGPYSAFAKFLAPPAPVGIALPDEFMKRLAEKSRNFRRSSECEATAQGVVDKKTGKTGGYIFTVSDIFWISPIDVEVSGGLSVGATAGTNKTYYLKKAEGKWQVVGEHLKSIAGG